MGNVIESCCNAFNIDEGEAFTPFDCCCDICHIDEEGEVFCPFEYCCDVHIDEREAVPPHMLVPWIEEELKKYHDEQMATCPAYKERQLAKRQRKRDRRQKKIEIFNRTGRGRRKTNRRKKSPEPAKGTILHSPYDLDPSTTYYTSTDAVSDYDREFDNGLYYVYSSIEFYQDFPIEWE